MVGQGWPWWMQTEHVKTADTLYATLQERGLPVLHVHTNCFADEPGNYVVKLAAPWAQYNRDVQPGTWLQTIRANETVDDLIAAYRRDYPSP